MKIIIIETFTSSHLFMSLQAIITLAFCLAKASTTSLPMPLLAPVTIKTLFERSSVPWYGSPPNRSLFK